MMSWEDGLSWSLVIRNWIDHWRDIRHILDSNLMKYCHKDGTRTIIVRHTCQRYKSYMAPLNLADSKLQTYPPNNTPQTYKKAVVKTLGRLYGELTVPMDFNFF